MELGVYAQYFGAPPLDEALEAIRSAGLEAIVVVASPLRGGKDPLGLLRLARDASERRSFLRRISAHGLEIAALACRDNPFHPDPGRRRAARARGEGAIRLASLLGVGTVIQSSGRPADHLGARHPNWVTYSWPPDAFRILDRQWHGKALPFWRERARFAAGRGVRVAVELDPAFLVYDVAGVLRLRAVAGEAMGSAIDVGRLLRQGMDPSAVAVALEGAVFHVHAGGAREGVPRRLVAALAATGFDGFVSFDEGDLARCEPEPAIRGAVRLGSLLAR